MSQLTERVLMATPERIPANAVIISRTLAGLGLVALLLGFLGGRPAVSWVALLVSVSLVAGLAVAGVVLAAIYQMTNARWGRSYIRLAEAGVALMPLALGGLVVLLIGGESYLPWAHDHHLSGSKGLWLTRGFWDMRVLGYVLLTFGVALAFVYFSLRRDLCVPGVAERFAGRLASRVGRGIEDPAKEAERCRSRLTVLAPIVALVYAWAYSYLGVDLIMALEPTWYSTLFGAWYFFGNIFVGLAMVGLISLALRSRLPLEPFLPPRGQADLATLLFAFVLVNIDFFWSQYLTIWYGNMPEETHYLMVRSMDPALPYRWLSWISLSAFFFLPFLALIFRRVKTSAPLLATVSLIVITGIFLARFLEIAPPLLRLPRGTGLIELLWPLLIAVLVFLGFLGAAMLLYGRLLTAVPIMPLGDNIFVRLHGGEEE